jgi:hypothetical protein
MSALAVFTLQAPTRLVLSHLTILLLSWKCNVSVLYKSNHAVQNVVEKHICGDA